MSHSKERHEKICLNCQADLYGRYCHKCGQENIEPKETTWGLISHFFYDITHFDGKFFSTAKKLFIKPGFLPKEYIAGRRASYLHPIRMYVFTSALFFLVMFAMVNMKDGYLARQDKKDKAKDSVAAQVAAEKAMAMKETKDARDSVTVLKKLGPVKIISKDANDNIIELYDDKGKREHNALDFGNSYHSHEEYDSVQLSLPAGERDGWLKRRLTYRNIDLNTRYREDKREFKAELLEKFEHSIPYLLFISLPLFALFLKLLYVRRRQFYYVDHGLFLIYLYIFTFLYLLVMIGVERLSRIKHLGVLSYLELLLMLFGVYYAYKAMRTFYGQGRGKTLLKFISLNILSVFTIIILFIIFFIISLFRV